MIINGKYYYEGNLNLTGQLYPIKNEIFDKNKEKIIKGKDEDEEKKEINKLKSIEQKIYYKYNDKGVLIHKLTGQKCGLLGKEEYELVGKYVEKYIEIYLIKKFNLKTLYLPNKYSSDFTKRDKNQAQCKILTTQDFPTNPKCLIIIQGGGPVKLGQWARSVCINDNLNLGSMIPYVNKAIKNNFSVIIFNPNERTDFSDYSKFIQEFYSNEKHSVYVYNNIVKKNRNIKEIYIVAHSMGGDCTIEILLNNKDDLINGRIKKIAFTDSVHGNKYLLLDEKSKEIFRKISRNYVRSQMPVGTFLKSYNQSIGGTDCYSSGSVKHEYTSGYAIEDIFNFFQSQENYEYAFTNYYF